MRLLLLVGLAILSTGPVGAYQSQHGVAYQVETVTEGLDSPWSIEFLPDRRILVSERPGRLRIVRDGVLSAPLSGVPKVAYVGQGGLMDICLHPNFRRNQLLYLSYTVAVNNYPELRVSRFKFSDHEISDETIIFETRLRNSDPAHFGSRMVFARDGKLYITHGERHDKEYAQDLSRVNGKIFRLNEDGTIPRDNPFYSMQKARKEIFSYGHRNPQGIDVHPDSGRIYITEHGPSGYDAPGGGDEINLVEAGKNYGWPIIHHRLKLDKLESPIAEFTPANAPAGMRFYTGQVFPAWKHNLFFTTLRDRSLYRLKITDGRVIQTERMLQGKYGRLRDVAVGPDGYIYFISSDTDAYGPGRSDGDGLYRIVPDR